MKKSVINQWRCELISSITTSQNFKHTELERTCWVLFSCFFWLKQILLIYSQFKVQFWGTCTGVFPFTSIRSFHKQILKERTYYWNFMITSLKSSKKRFRQVVYFYCFLDNSCDNKVRYLTQFFPNECNILSHTVYAAGSPSESCWLRFMCVIFFFTFP